MSAHTGRAVPAAQQLSVVEAAMFTPCKSSIDPATMRAALEAFELAWAEIMAHPNGYDVPAARDLLATRIIEAALTGERDPAQLKAYALERLSP